MKAFVLLPLALLLVACGAKTHAQALKGSCPSRPAKLVKAPALPPHLPLTKATTLSAVQRTAGATEVSGYVASGLASAAPAYRAALSGFRITNDRRHTGDEELGFAGSAGRGQVKLVQACSNLTTVAITFRGA